MCLFLWLLLIHPSSDSLWKARSGIFLRWLLPTAPWPLWSLPESLDFFKSRRGPPPSVSSVKRAPCYTGFLEDKALRFCSHTIAISLLQAWRMPHSGRGAGPGSVLQRLGVVELASELGNWRHGRRIFTISLYGFLNYLIIFIMSMPRRIRGWWKQCPECDDRSGPYQNGWCGILF